MTARTYAALCGAIYLTLGIAGFVPWLWERAPTDPTLSIRVFHAPEVDVANNSYFVTDPPIRVHGERAFRPFQPFLVIPDRHVDLANSSHCLRSIAGAEPRRSGKEL